mgnify:CR=1 FL=1
MSILLNGDCLEELKGLDDESVDLIFCDLPYGQTSCKWDCLIDLDKLWIEFMRIKKLNTPIVMTCTTKFGVSLINSAPKKCPFRYDIIWCKSASCSFLSAKKMPMRKHEMVYFFYEKLPFYDLSSHTHKFIKADNNVIDGPALPTSLIKEKEFKENPNHKDDLYGIKSGNVGRNKGFHQKQYDPPLPTSLVKEVIVDKEDVYNYTERLNNGKLKATGNAQFEGANGKPLYDPPLPTSLIKEVIVDKEYKTCYGEVKIPNHLEDKKGDRSRWKPPLPTSLLEIKSTRGHHSTEKPTQLMEWILKYYTKDGDVVLDPTMGSGSMGVSCKAMNRNFIGIEKDPEIYEYAVNRID